MQAVYNRNNNKHTEQLLARASLQYLRVRQFKKRF